MKTINFFIKQFNDLNVPVNQHHLIRYLKFVLSQPAASVVENHHILPKAPGLFPQFTSLAKHPWNTAPLSPRAHYIAHAILWRALPGNRDTRFGFWAMCTGTRDGRTYKINSRMFEKLRIEHRNSDFSHLSEAAKGRKFITRGGVTKRVKIENLQPYLDDSWVIGTPPGLMGNTNAKGTVWVLSPTGERRMVRPEEVDALLADGWIKSNPASKSDISDAVKGTIWVNRGDDHLRIDASHLQKYRLDGWAKGRKMTEAHIQKFVGKRASDATKDRMKQAATSRPRVCCSFCRKEIDVCNFTKLHRAC